MSGPANGEEVSAFVLNLDETRRHSGPGDWRCQSSGHVGVAAAIAAPLSWPTVRRQRRSVPLCTRGAGLFSVNYSPSFVESQREFASKLSTCTRSCRGPRTRSDARTRTHTIPVRTAKFGSVCVPGYVWKARVARALGLSGFHSGSERQPSRRHYCPGLPWAPGLHIGLCVGRVPSNSLRTLRFGAGAAPRGVIPSQPTQPTQVHRPRRAGF